MNIIDVEYKIDTNEIKVIYEKGIPTYYKLDHFEPIDANERELGVETEYLIDGKLHVFFYPEGVLSDFYLE